MYIYLKQEWLLVFQNKIQTHRRFEKRTLLWYNMGIFRVMPLFSSYKTTLKQGLNGEKWDVGHLSALGWAISVRCSGVQCWEEFCCNNSARIILNHASDISYAQPWWVSLVCRTCVDCSPGAGTRPWSKSSWTAASCWCWAPPCPWCPKCWVSVSLLACLCVCLFSLSVPTVVWSDSFSAPLPCPWCSKCWVSVWLLVCLCVCLLSPSPLLFGQTLSLHRCSALAGLLSPIQRLEKCYANVMNYLSLSSPHVWPVSHLTYWLVCSAMSVGLTGYMSVCPACLPDLSCWSVWPVILFCLTCPVMSVWHVWPVVLFLTCHACLTCLTCHVELSDLLYFSAWPVMSVLCVWPVMLICLTCCIISVWHVWPVMLICEMSYKLDLLCVCLICHVGPSDRYIQAVMLICLNCHVCQYDLSCRSVWLASGQSHSPTPLFCRHPGVQNNILPNKVQWSVLLLFLGSSHQESMRCFCPSFYLCQCF